jgi:hypothetical protein
LLSFAGVERSAGETGIADRSKFGWGGVMQIGQYHDR